MIEFMIFERHPTFRFRGRRYSLRESGLRAIRVLNRAVSAQYSSFAMLRLRTQIREVIASGPPILLCCLLDRSRVEIKLRLVILILSKRGEQMAINDIFAHHDHASAKVRLAVVRALHRLHAWDKLRMLAEITEDDTVRRAAGQKERPEFANRMASFLSVVSPCEVGASDHPLYVAANVSVDERFPPRSHWAIGQILQRIRTFVHRSRLRRMRSIFSR